MSLIYAVKVVAQLDDALKFSDVGEVALAWIHILFYFKQLSYVLLLSAYDNHLISYSLDQSTR